jgi:hypothetical protein
MPPFLNINTGHMTRTSWGMFSALLGYSIDPDDVGLALALTTHLSKLCKSPVELQIVRSEI